MREIREQDNHATGEALYTEDAVWETPARNVTYRGRETIKKMYLRVFSSAEGMIFQPIERFATLDRVFAGHEMYSQAILGCRGFQLDFLGWEDDI